MKKNKLIGACLAAGLLVAGCGDDGGDSAGSNEYSDAVADAIRSDGDVPFSDDEVDCVAREMVDALGGPDTFADADIAPEDLADTDSLADSGLEVTEEQAKDVAQSFGTCDIDLTDAFLDGLGEDIPADVRSCVEESFGEDVFADLFAQAFVSGGQGDDLPPEVLQDLTECIS